MTTSRGRFKDYEDPKTFAEADRRIIELTTDIRLIDIQLGKRKKGSKGYTDWRSRTLTAKAYKERDLRLIKLWKEENKEKLRVQLLRIDNIEPYDPRSLLRGMYAILTKVLKEYDLNGHVTEAEWRIIDQAKIIALEDA